MSKSIASASIEIVSVYTNICPYCKREISTNHSIEDEYLKRKKTCEACGKEVETIQLLKEFYDRESWPMITIHDFNLNVVAFNIYAKTNTFNVIEFGKNILGEDDEIVELYFRKGNERIFTELARKTTNFPFISKKQCLYIVGSCNQENVTIPVQMSYINKTLLSQDSLKLLKYQALYSFSIKEYETFLLYSQMIIETLLRKYFEYEMNNKNINEETRPKKMYEKIDYINKKFNKEFPVLEDITNIIKELIKIRNNISHDLEKYSVTKKDALRFISALEIYEKLLLVITPKENENNESAK